MGLTGSPGVEGPPGPDGPKGEPGDVGEPVRENQYMTRLDPRSSSVHHTARWRTVTNPKVAT